LAHIELLDIAHAYRPNPRVPADYALQRLNLIWDDGGAYALLGPSGSGKSTLLNILSGLVTPTEGRLLFDGADVTSQPPRQRNIAQVFQFPVIYDTMSVFDNLAFPLRNRGIDAATVRVRVHQVAEILELTADLKHRAAGLTADAKQRISMGRGLVRKDVAAILFDEPLTVIDPHLKWVLRRKLKQIHHELKITLIYVTHDQTEALTFADRVVVMDNGAVLQQGSPQDLFEEPQHAFVGHFIGSPGMNLLPCRLDGDAAVVEDQRVALGVGVAARAPGTAVIKLGIRPEFVGLSSRGDGSAVRVTVHEVEALGGHQLILAALGSQRLMLKVPPEAMITAGQTLSVWLPRERVKLYADDRLVG
jgi:glycerol transport system ATP-binding protein